MPVSIGRKLQAFKDAEFPDLEFEVSRSRSTESRSASSASPMHAAEGDREARATAGGARRWRSRADRDRRARDPAARAAPRDRPRRLRPLLRPTLDQRARVESDWLAEAQEALDAAIDGDLIAALHAEAEAKLAGVRAEIDRINDQLRASTEVLGIELPDPPEPPEPELPEGGGLPPLVSSAWPWREQCRALIARKRYGNDAAGAP